MRKVEIGERASVTVKWHVKPSDYSREGEENIAFKFANKYGIPRERVKVEPDFMTVNGDSEDALVMEAAKNIQDPAFQKSLFSVYIKENGIEDYDSEKLNEIDNLINSQINYDLYDKHKKYSIKWIKWSNFMSFGPDNFIDLTKLNGLVLLTSEPANQGGKTTFCLDLFRFLLFGKVTSRESGWTLARAFNDHIPEATEMTVEGCISIDGIDYVIKRVLSRPELKKRTERSKVTNKVEYFKLVNGEYVSLDDDEDVENESGTGNRETNKTIKEAIGNESDFDLMICVDSSNLKGLISLKDTDRGRLISRWIGLLPLEEKDKLAREYFNKSVSPKLTMNRYNKEELAGRNIELEEVNKELIENGVKWSKEKEESDKRIDDYRETRDILLKSRLQLDDEIANVDKHTVEESKERITEDGKRKAEEKEANKKKYEALKSVVFDEDEYKSLVKEERNLSFEANDLEKSIIRKKNEVNALKKGEFCPTCGAKLKGVDNTKAISEAEAWIEESSEKLAKLDNKIKKLQKEIDEKEADRAKYNEKIKLELIIEKNESDIENLRGKLKECNRILRDLKKNEEAISHNNEVDAKINVIDENIKVETSISRDLESKMNDARNDIKTNKKTISENKSLIEVIESEEKLVKTWKLYLDMIGKNGISKIVLRNALPMINGELHRLLSDVCDFDVEVSIDNRNDVAFHMLHDRVRRSLGSGSGLEQTVASLALRSVLSKMSTFSKPCFVVFDEILGGVADENYDNVKRLYDKIVKDYSFILEITHLKAIADWHQTSLVVKKENNISKIENA